MERQTDKQSGRTAQRMWTRLSLGSALALTPLFAGTSETKAEQKLVVSRLEIAGGGYSKPSLHHVEGKRYLYAHRASDRNLAIIDVTDEAKPQVVKTLTADPSAATENVDVLPGGTVLLSSAKAANAAQAAPAYSISLWNPSNGGAPQEIASATGHLLENSRGLLYVFDDTGLTLIRLNESPEKLEVQRWESTLAR